MKKNCGWLLIVGVFFLSIIEALGPSQLLTGSRLAHGAEKQASEESDKEAMQKVLLHYSMIHKSLAADSVAQINDDAALLLSSARKLKNKNLSDEIQASARRLRSNIGMGHPSFPQAREEFKKLSGPIVEWVKKNKPEGWVVIHCSMADASWVQRKDQEIQNPYTGKEMPKCGERVE